MIYLTLPALNEEILSCRKCLRLVAWREETGRKKTRRFQDWCYWSKPVKGFGAADARLWVIGLAPAAHGGNRTGRVFTGDRSGDWLFRALFNSGFANQPESISRMDGLKLRDCYVSAIIRCAPPGNKANQDEIMNCREYLDKEFHLLKNLRVILCLGQISYDNTLKMLVDSGIKISKPKPKFKHALMISLNKNLTLAASYHPSQQNTFTGVLNEKMFNEIFFKINRHLYKSDSIG